MDLFTGRFSRIGAALVVLGVMFVTTGFSLAAFAAPGNGNGNGNGGGNHIEICHFSGQMGNGSFETLTVSANSNGHFHNNGTNRAGHEADYLGPCVVDEGDDTGDTSSTTVADTTPTSTGDATSTTVADTTSTSAEDTTSTTVADTTPTSTEDTSSTTVADTTPTSTEDATSTTVADTTPTSTEDATPTTTTLVDGDESVIAPVERDSTTTTSAPAAESAAAGVEVETLPYTGPNTYLVVPGVILLLIGGLAVFLSHGFGGTGRPHMAAEQGGISLGLHRGRHES